MSNREIDAVLMQLCDKLNEGASIGDVEKMRILRLVRTFAPQASPEVVAATVAVIAQRFTIDPPIIKYCIEADDVDLEQVIRPRAMESEFPSDGFIGRYIDYTMGHEAPVIFHFWTAVSLIAAAAKRAYYFDKAYYKVHCNHYIVFIAPSGVTKKSTAANIGVALLRAVPGVHIIGEKITPEALVNKLKGYAKIVGSGAKVSITGDSTAIIFAPELGVFLGKQQYNEGLIALLISLWDAPDEFDATTIARKEERLRNVALCIFGCCTPEWLSDAFPSKAAGMGLLNRMLFVYQERTPRIFPFPELPDSTLRSWLIEWLSSFTNGSGVFTQTDEARDWHIEWYIKNRRELERQESLHLAGYYERRQDHLIRLAMVLRLSKAPDHCILELEDYIEAERLLGITEKYMPGAFRKIGIEVSGQRVELVKRHIAAAGGRISRSALCKKVYGVMDGDGLEAVINTLLMARDLAVMHEGKTTYYSLVGSED